MTTKATKKNAAPITLPAAVASLQAKVDATMPKSAMTCRGYGAPIKAGIVSVLTHAEAAHSAGMKVATGLAELFVMEPWTISGHKDATQWALALLTEALPTAGQSTKYAWVDAAVARCAIVADGTLDIADFPMDTLRVAGARMATGHDPVKIVELAKKLAANPDLRNAKGSIDPAKAAKAAKGKSTELTRMDMIKAIRSCANRYAPNDAQGAWELLRDAAESQLVVVNGAKS